MVWMFHLALAKHSVETPCVEHNLMIHAVNDTHILIWLSSIYHKVNYTCPTSVLIGFKHFHKHFFESH
jgi:hypothetical protein